MNDTTITYNNFSVASATGASQTLLGVKGTVEHRLIQNISATDWWINMTGGTAAVDGSGCIKLAAGQSISGSWTNAVTGIGTATAKLTVLEAV